VIAIGSDTPITPQHEERIKGRLKLFNKERRREN
jgi:hypothetical protein